MPNAFLLVDPSTWKSFNAELYYPPNYDSEGFIHLSYNHQLEWAANKFYAKASGAFALEINLDSLSSFVQEESAAVPGINLIEMSIRKVQDRMALERENEAAILARNASNYAASNKVTLSGTDLWTNAASNPFVVVESGKEAIRKKIGKRPQISIRFHTTIT